jgi:hypothetical protein
MELFIEKSLCGQLEVAFPSQLKILRSNPSTVQTVKNHVDSNVNGPVTVVLSVSKPSSKSILMDCAVVVNYCALIIMRSLFHEVSLTYLQ